jgi:hypothetical protein
MVLAPAVITLELTGSMALKTEVYSVQIGAVVLSALLPRHMNTLTKLDLRCVQNIVPALEFVVDLLEL